MEAGSVSVFLDLCSERFPVQLLNFSMRQSIIYYDLLCLFVWLGERKTMGRISLIDSLSQVIK